MTPKILNYVVAMLVKKNIPPSISIIILSILTSALYVADNESLIIFAWFLFVNFAGQQLQENLIQNNELYQQNSQLIDVKSLLNRILFFYSLCYVFVCFVEIARRNVLN